MILLGAGYHSPTNSDLYKQICKQACLQVRPIYLSGLLHGSFCVIAIYFANYFN